MSALTSVRYDPNSQALYDRRRAGGGKRHPQAVIALARRRVSVLWALIPAADSTKLPRPDSPVQCTKDRQVYFVATSIRAGSSIASGRSSQFTIGE